MSVDWHQIPRALLFRIVMSLICAGTACALVLESNVTAAGEAQVQGEVTTPSAAIVKVCTACHGLQLVLDTPRNYDSWHETVQEMINRGASGTPAEFDLVMEFLFQNVTTIDINGAGTDTLETILEISPETASVIVKKRKDHPFKSVADLEARVPGLDKAVLQAKKRMIFFH